MSKMTVTMMMLELCVVLLMMVDPGRSLLGANGYTEYRAGDVDSHLIVVASHGGYLQPANITDRTHGCYNVEQEQCVWEHGCGESDGTRCRAATLMDYYTLDLAILIVEEYHKLSGSRPHLILNHLKRNKMDANRDQDTAAMGDPDAMRAWAEFHGFIENAKTALPDGQGLILDIHGQGHSELWTELGYSLSKSELNNDVTLNKAHSSIRHLAGLSKVSFDELLRGNQSLGGLLQSQGYVTVPSPAHSGPAEGNYYTGGYITRRHGSRDGGTVDAIQIELPRFLRSEESSPGYAVDLAQAVEQFMTHYQLPTGNSSSGARSTKYMYTFCDGLLVVFVLMFLPCVCHL